MSKTVRRGGPLIPTSPAYEEALQRSSWPCLPPCGQRLCRSSLETDLHGAHETWAAKHRGKVWVEEPVIQQRAAQRDLSSRWRNKGHGG